MMLASNVGDAVRYQLFKPALALQFAHGIAGAVPHSRYVQTLAFGSRLPAAAAVGGKALLLRCPQRWQTQLIC